MTNKQAQFINQLKEIFATYPDLRIGQMLVNFLPIASLHTESSAHLPDTDVFYVKDDEILGYMRTEIDLNVDPSKEKK